MKILLDTSVLIEYIKGSRTKLLESLINNEKNKLYINDIVYSEFMFHFLSVISGKSPFTLKKKNEISNLLLKYDPIEFLENFIIVPISEETIKLSYEYMKKYNLLPNDSLILATCKIQELDAIASFDSDFVEVVKREDLMLITD